MCNHKHRLQKPDIATQMFIQVQSVNLSTGEFRSSATALVVIGKRVVHCKQAHVSPLYRLHGLFGNAIAARDDKFQL